MPKGTFIVFEGADGCGKSTHARMLAEHLKSKGLDVVLTQEPTRGVIGRLIRAVLAGKEKVSPQALALLFTADRAEHVDRVLKPAIDGGKVVISDRYYYSTVAYQSLQGVSPQWVSQLNAFAPEPDLVIVLEVESGEALSRKGESPLEVFENLGFQERVQKALLDLAYGGHAKLSKPGKAWKVLKNTEDAAVVQARIRELADALV